MRNLADRIPWEVRADLAAATAVLVAHGPAVVAALALLDEATTAAWWASMVPASLDPAETAEQTDDEWAALERATGIDRGWSMVNALANAQL
jgi:hypothetical protein